jgi:hypothetical protein
MNPSANIYLNRHTIGQVSSAIQSANPSLKVKYIDKTRSDVLEEAKEKKQTASLLTNGFLGVSGFATGVLGVVAVAGMKYAAAASAIALVATPVGWSIVGLLAVSVLIMACRHQYLKNQGLQTDTKDSLITGAAYTAGGVGAGLLSGVVIVGVVAFLSGRQEENRGGGGERNRGDHSHHNRGFNNGFVEGFLVADMLSGPRVQSPPVIIYNNVERRYEIPEQPQFASSPDTLFLYKDDMVKVPAQPPLHPLSQVPSDYPQSPIGYVNPPSHNPNATNQELDEPPPPYSVDGEWSQYPPSKPPPGYTL